VTATVIPLVEAHDEAQYGAKAVGLGEATRAGLPIPPGIALSGDIVDAIVGGDVTALNNVMVLARDLPTPFAVRSSAVGEDSADASFAGQHLTLLNVRTADDLLAALNEIWWSANSDSAITYRQRVGLFIRPSIGVVVQSLLAPKAAGVMFTRNPVTGADERMIEASWGLGEVVVSALVIPDNFRLAPDGTMLDQRPGVKKIALRILPDGGTEEIAVAPELVEQPCLDAAQLVQLNDLATRCEEVYGQGRDIEWAIADGQLYLLQCRAITRTGASNPKSAASSSKQEPPDVLTSVPFFNGLPDDEVDRITRLFRTRTFSAGEVITKEGAGGAAFFVVESGNAVVTVHGREVARFSRGDYFGEIALIDNGVRTATVTAATQVVCHGLTYWEFRPLVQTNATVAWNLLQTLAKRLRTIQE
jgi:pyruvate,water dikinase